MGHPIYVYTGTIQFGTYDYIAHWSPIVVFLVTCPYFSYLYTICIKSRPTINCNVLFWILILSYLRTMYFACFYFPTLSNTCTCKIGQVSNDLWASLIVVYTIFQLPLMLIVTRNAWLCKAHSSYAKSWNTGVRHHQTDVVLVATECKL